MTDRSQTEDDHTLPGAIHETAEAVTAEGGEGIAVCCDHADDAQPQAPIGRVKREQGRFDLLANNAAAVHEELTAPGLFWEKPLKTGRPDRCRLRDGYPNIIR